MTTEDIRRRARRELTEKTSVETADYLLERPPGGWDNLPTKADVAHVGEIVDTKLDALRHELKGEMTHVRSDLGSEIAQLRNDMHEDFRSQTWRLITAMTAIVGVIVAAFGVAAAFLA